MGRKPKQVEGSQLSTVQKNLQRFRIANGLTQHDLDDYTIHLGGRGRTQKYESGEAEPTDKYLALVAIRLGKSVIEFRREDDDSLPDVDVPYWGLVPCGEWERPENNLATRTVPGKIARLGQVVVVTAAGPSMKPKIKEGQEVSILLTKQYADGNIALIHNQNGELSLKLTRYVKGEWEFQSRNPEHPSVKAEKVSMLGRAVYIPEQFDPDGLAM